MNYTSEKIFFERIVENIKSCLLLINLSEDVLYLNKEAAELFQSKLPHIQALTSPIIKQTHTTPPKLKEVVSSAIYQVLKDIIHQVARSKGHSRIESISVPGSETMIGLTVYPIHNDIGSIIGLIFIAKNITNILKKQQLDNLNQKMIENIKTGLLAISPENHIMFVNETGKEVYHIRTKHPEGKPMEDVIPTPLAAAIEKSILSIQKTGRKHRTDAIEIIEGNETYYVGFTGSAVFPDGKEKPDIPIGYVFSGAIITEIVIAEREKEEYLKQVKSLIKAIKEVKSGKFHPESIELITKRQDELGELAKVFQQTAKTIMEREQQVKEQMSILKSKINESEKEKELFEITNSHFFQSLKEKAGTLRNQMKVGKNHE